MPPAGLRACGILRAVSTISRSGPCEAGALAGITAGLDICKKSTAVTGNQSELPLPQPFTCHKYRHHTVTRNQVCSIQCGSGISQGRCTLRRCPERVPACSAGCRQGSHTARQGLPTSYCQTWQQPAKPPPAYREQAPRRKQTRQAACTHIGLRGRLADSRKGAPASLAVRHALLWWRAAAALSRRLCYGELIGVLFNSASLHVHARHKAPQAAAPSQRCLGARAGLGAPLANARQCTSRQVRRAVYHDASKANTVSATLLQRCEHAVR